jgi:hypothetical protein
MKRLIGCAALTLAAGLAGPAVADEPEVHFTVEVTSVSSYVWRGDRLSSDGMRPLLQPYAEVAISSVGPGSLTFGLWSSSALAEDSVAQELDPYVSYTVPAGPLALKAGYAVYILPEADVVDSMHEFSLQATTEWEFPVKLYLGAAVDPIRTEGWYGFGGATLAFAAGPVNFSTALNVGGSDYAAVATSLQDVTLSSRASYGLGDSGMYVAASAAAAYSGRAEELYPYAGLSFGISR